MKKILLLPLWIVQIFTQAKSFSKNPLLGSPWLNRLGLHIMRMLIAHFIMRIRMLMLSRNIEPEFKTSYFENGYILIPNFLESQQYESLKQEIYTVNAEVRECVQGDTLTHRIMLDSKTIETMPVCEATLNQDKLKKLLRFTSGKFTRPVSYIQTIKNHYISGPQDPQKNLHSDTFHPTMKSWYFLDDVDETNGPFTFIPGSHRLTFARLKWEYKRSIEISTIGDRYSGNGSLRINEADAKAMNLASPRAFKVHANTLIIANTHGFHCRGNASTRSTRTELWSISRNNPFNPLPGIDHPATRELQNRALNAWRRYCDQKALSRGTESSWHIIEARNTVKPD